MDQMKPISYIPISLLALALALHATAAAAQQADGRIVGHVTDEETGAPLPGVLVHLEDPRRHEVTHEDGAFHLLRLPPGRYEVVFEQLGYRTASRTVVLEAGESRTLAVALRPAPLEIEGLVVTATMAGRASQEALQPTTVVAGRDFQRQLSATLAGTLEGEAGVAVSSMGAPARPVIRGLGGDRVLILEDGERMGDISAASADHAVALDPIGAERIEVVRGPAALFYGSNALGGVVNVITEEIPSTLPDRFRADGTFQGNSATEGLAAAGSATTAFGPVGVRGSGSFRDTGELETPLGAVPNTDMTAKDGAAGLAWVGDWGHAGGVVRLHDTEYGIAPDPVSGHEDGVRIETRRTAARGQLHWTTRAGPFEHVELDAKATRLDHRELEGGGVVGTEFGLNTHAAELTGRHDGIGPFVRGAVGVRVGLADYGADRGRGPVLSVDERDAAVYAMEELEAGAWSLQVGGRYDYAWRVVDNGPATIEGVPVRDREFRNFAGSVAALYEVLPGTRLGASVSRAFRTPSSDELYSAGPHLASYTFEVGNPELRPETGHGVDLFLRTERDRLRLELAAYLNRIDDYVYPRNTGAVRGDLFVYRFTNTSACFVGGEAAVEWSPVRHVALDGASSWVRATNRTLDEPLPLIPPLSGRVAVRYERSDWYGQLGWRGAAEQDRVPPRPELPEEQVGYCDQTDDAPGCRPVPGEFTPTGGYGLWSAALGYRFFPAGGVHSITFSIENLTDEAYRNHLSRIKRLAPEQGRSLKVTYRAGI